MLCPCLPWGQCQSLCISGKGTLGWQYLLNKDKCFQKGTISSFLLESEAALCFYGLMALSNTSTEKTMPRALGTGSLTRISFCKLCYLDRQHFNSKNIEPDLHFNLKVKFCYSFIFDSIYRGTFLTSALALALAPWWCDGGEGSQAWDPDRLLSQPWIHTTFALSCFTGYLSFLRLGHYICKIM